MHEHLHQHDGEEVGTGRRPGLDGPNDTLLWRAAVAGRSDVIGRDGMAKLQRSLGNRTMQRLATDEARSPVLDVVGSGGDALAPPLRAEMEGRLGHDFGDVRVHTDSAASASAQAVNAHAYTVGRDVVFQRDAWDPNSEAGKTTLAHELTHVVQQRTGPVDGTPTGDGVQVSDPGDRFEVEAAATASQAMSSPFGATGPDVASLPAAAGGHPTVQALTVQRAEQDEPVPTTPLQALTVQREGDEEDEPA